MSGKVVAVLVETHGKQAYLFNTSRRRESVGASQLIHEVPKWAQNELKERVGPKGVGLLDEGGAAEVVVDTSGTFLAFVRDPEVARQVVTQVTLRALRDAPGLGVTGGLSEPFEWGDGGAPQAVRSAFQVVDERRINRPPPLARFPVLPVTELCPSSALPVSAFVPIGSTREPRSAVSAAKWLAYPHALDRMAELTGLSRQHLEGAPRRLDGNQPDSPSRVALVHADGNGLGEVFAELPQLLAGMSSTKRGSDADYAAAYRELSTALDEAVGDAFKETVAEFIDLMDRELDVLPLVLAGDDITYVVEAEVATAFTHSFLTRLIRRVANDPRAATVLQKRRGNDPRLGIAGALVVTTPHFPFSTAYQLCEELGTAIAKRAKERLTDSAGDPVPSLSLAFHVQLDSSVTTVNQLLETARVNGRLLTAMPYVDLVEMPGVNRSLSKDSVRWLRNRELDGLKQLAAVLAETDQDGRRVRPMAQLHELRSRLRPDPAAADEYLGRLRGAHKKVWQPLVEEGNSLFTTRDDSPPTTRYADALALVPLLVGPSPARGTGNA